MKLLFSVFFLAIVAFSNADDCHCRLRTNNRIVKGEMVAEHSMPWIVSLAEKESHICGGSIMNEKFILTSANCVEKKKTRHLTVRVGTIDIKNQIPKNQIYQVKKIHSHEFKGLEVPGDIAILELSKKIEFIEGIVEKGCFNLGKKDYSEPLLAAGYGRTDISYKVEKDNKLMQNGVQEQLKQAFFNQVTECKDFLICLKNMNEKESICDGDFGGPLHYTENGITTIEGVGSYAEGSPNEDVMFYCLGNSAFSRLSYYADWISQTAEYDFCGAGEKKEVEKKKRFGLF